MNLYSKERTCQPMETLQQTRHRGEEPEAAERVHGRAGLEPTLTAAKEPLPTRVLCHWRGLGGKKSFPNGTFSLTIFTVSQSCVSLYTYVPSCKYHVQYQ